MVYTVQHMKTYSMSVVRERLAEALDEAEQGLPVVIERRGVRYRLSVEPSAPRTSARRRSRIDVVDPAVEAGAWSWDATATGVKFRPRRSK